MGPDPRSKAGAENWNVSTRESLSFSTWSKSFKVSILVCPALGGRLRQQGRRSVLADP